MHKRFYIITTVILTALLLPNMIISTGLLFKGIYYLGLLGLLLYLLAPEWERTNKATVPDWIAAFIMPILTLGLGMFLGPQENVVPLSYPLLLVIFSILIATVEELFFRFWMIAGMIKSGWTALWAIIVSSILFASLHWWQGWQAVIFAGIAGTLYGMYFAWRRVMTTIVIAHILHNTLAIIILISHSTS